MSPASGRTLCHETLTLEVTPRQVDEFTCSACFVVCPCLDCPPDRRSLSRLRPTQTQRLPRSEEEGGSDVCCNASVTSRSRMLPSLPHRQATAACTAQLRHGTGTSTAHTTCVLSPATAEAMWARPAPLAYRGR